MKAEKFVHPWWVRLTHWLNAVAVIVMVLSGWRIYDATNFMGFHIPDNVTLGGWLGGALLWHFAAMWLLAFNGALYLVLTLTTRRFFHKFFPLRIGDIFRDLKDALRGHLSHYDLSRFNAVQKAAYLFAILDSVVLVASGLVLWKSVQFPHLRDLMLGYEGARRVHFLAMAGIVLFFVVHVTMALLVPRSLMAMLWGGKKYHD